MSRKTLPKAMSEWSEPLKEGQWAKPSDELKRQSRRMLELQKAYPDKSTLEIFLLVSEEAGANEAMTA